MMARGARGNRPAGIARLNRASPQARGLTLWAPSSLAGLADLAGRGPLSPVLIRGTGPAPYFNAGSMGMVARSERIGVTLDRAWQLPTPGPLDGLSSFTLAYWVYPLAPFAVDGGSFWGQGTGNSVFCETGGTGLSTGPYLRSMGDFRGTFTEVATVGAWQLLAWRVSSTIAYARNGIVQQTGGSPSGSIATADAPFYVGGQPSGSGAQTIAVDALWADFRIYNRALSDAELWALYDPSTRWDLYQVPSTRVYVDLATPPPPATRGYRLALMGVS